MATPAAFGIGVAIAWAAGDTQPPVDPVSVVALGSLATLAALTRSWRETTLAGRRSWRVVLAAAAWASSAVLVAWVVANRIAGIPTGSLRPSTVLAGAVGFVVAALATARWGPTWVSGLRRAWAWYDARADAVNAVTIVAVAGFFRAAIMFRVPVFVIGDSGVYVEAAATFLARGSFAALDDYLPPAYSVFMGAVQFALGTDFLGVVAVQHLLGIGTALVTYRLGRTVLPPWIALLPAVGVAADGYLLIVEHGIYTEALFIPLTVLAAYSLVRLIWGGSWRQAAVAGAMVALATLARMVLQPVVPLVLVAVAARDGWAWYRTPAERRPSAWWSGVRAFAFAVAFGVVVAPWMAHNWWQHRYLGLSNGLGLQLMVRLWEEEAEYQWANPAHPDATVRRALQALQEEKDRNSSYWRAWTRLGQEFTARHRSAAATQASLDVMWRHLATYLDRTWFRLQRMWRGGFAPERVHDLYGEQTVLGIRSPIFAVRADPSPDAEIEGNRADVLTRIFRPDTLHPGLALVLTLAAGAGAIAVPRLRPALIPLGFGVGLLVLAVLLAADRARYRHPAEPFLLLSYTVGAWALWMGAVALSRRIRQWRTGVSPPR